MPDSMSSEHALRTKESFLSSPKYCFNVFRSRLYSHLVRYVPIEISNVEVRTTPCTLLERSHRHSTQ